MAVNLGVVTPVNLGGLTVFIQTTDGTGSGGDATGDTLNGIENLIGSNFSDTLTGNLIANRLDGGAGNDSLFGEAGSDTLIGGTGANVLDGGTGTDTASYETATLGVTVSLTNGSATAGHFLIDDTLISIENIKGSNFSDTLNGDGNANRLEGGGGSDTINGGAGSDVIVGGAQNDLLSGGVNADTFLYLARSDSLVAGGSPGDRVLDFEVSNDKLDFRALGLNANNILIQNQTVNGINSSVVTEDLNGNGLVDDGEFSVSVTINGPSFVTLQDLLL